MSQDGNSTIIYKYYYFQYINHSTLVFLPSHGLGVKKVLSGENAIGNIII